MALAKVCVSELRRRICTGGGVDPGCCAISISGVTALLLIILRTGIWEFVLEDLTVGLSITM